MQNMVATSMKVHAACWLSSRALARVPCAQATSTTCVHAVRVAHAQPHACRAGSMICHAEGRAQHFYEDMQSFSIWRWNTRSNNVPGQLLTEHEILPHLQNQLQLPAHASFCLSFPASCSSTTTSETLHHKIYQTEGGIYFISEGCAVSIHDHTGCSTRQYTPVKMKRQMSMISIALTHSDALTHSLTTLLFLLVSRSQLTSVAVPGSLPIH